MSKLTPSEQVIAEKTVCILLVRGETPEQQKIYAYVAVRADKLESFMEAQKSGTFYPEDFGIVAILMLVVYFFDALSVVGSEQYIIQKSEVNAADLNTAWTLDIAIKTAVLGIDVGALA